MGFFKENLKQVVLLVILVAITAYAMLVGDSTMIDKILLAVLTALDVGALAMSVKNKPKE